MDHPDFSETPPESTVPCKKARRGRVSHSASNSRAGPNSRKRPGPMGREDTTQGGHVSSSAPGPPPPGLGPMPRDFISAGSQLPLGKMLLPRLHQRNESGEKNKPAGKERTSHACDKCRKAKAKCSGGQPCEKCKSEGRECVYGDGKRDRVKKELERLAKQNKALKDERRSFANFMRSIKEDGSIAPTKMQEMEDMLFKLNTNEANDAEADRQYEERRASADTGEDNADADDVASMGSLDVINEDTNRDEQTRAAGYLGKSSAVRWVQRTKEFLNDNDEAKGKGNIKNGTKGTPDNAFMKAATAADDSDFPVVEPDSVNAMDLPPSNVIQNLVNIYFTTVHPSLPILSERGFRHTLATFLMASPDEQLKTGFEKQDWLCSLNMVLSIAARYEWLTRDGESESLTDKDFLVHFARARRLGLDERALHRDAELQNTTSLGLVSLYFLTVDQVNRAWTWSGVALRSAMTLGLHIRSETKSLSDVDKEYRVRLFWSLYCLERLLNQLTGRPTCLSPRDICATLPLNLDEQEFDRERPLYNGEKYRELEVEGRIGEDMVEMTSHGASSASRSAESSPMDTSPISKFSSLFSTESSHGRNSISSMGKNDFRITSSTYFIYRVRLSIVSHEIFNDLYSPTMVKSKWGDVQNVIRRIDRTLRRWKSSLPWELDFDADEPDRSEPQDDAGWRAWQEKKRRWSDFAGERAGLCLFYNSSRMILYRPTLCKLGHSIRNESETSKSFNAQSAVGCIQAARNTIACLPPFPENVHKSHPYQELGDERSRNPHIIALHAFVPWWNTIHYIIEAASVLMLELAYRCEHQPSQAEAIFEDAKTAVGWMGALAPYNVSARKGVPVYEVLLRRVAPRIGRNAGGLTREGELPQGWEHTSSNRQNPGNTDGSSDTARWSGQNHESAAKFEPQQQQTQQPSRIQSMQTRQPYQMSAVDPFYNQMASAGQQNTDYPTMSGAMNGMNSLGLGALESFHFAGDAYGRYDDFGPWMANGFENFGNFDLDFQPQQTPSMGQQQINQPSPINQHINHARMAQSSPMGPPHVGMSSAGMGGGGSMSLPTATQSSNMGVGRAYAYDPTQVQQQINNQQPPPHIQLPQVNLSGMQAGYQPYAWDGSQLPPMVPQYQHQHQLPPQTRRQHAPPVSQYGTGRGPRDGPQL